MSAAAAATIATSVLTMAHPFLITHLANFLAGGATFLPGCISHGVLTNPSVRSSQCFFFRRVHQFSMLALLVALGCVATPSIAQGVAGTHPLDQLTLCSVHGVSFVPSR